MARGKGVGRVAGDLGLGALGLLAGVAAFLLFQATLGGASDAVGEPALAFEVPPGGAGADSPEGAVRLFLDAETGGDGQAAFDVLSEDDRVLNASAPLWMSRRPLGEVQSWDWADAENLVTTIVREPGLSLTRGWSPATSLVSWAVVDENGWRISLAETSVEPVLPDPADATDAAATWLGDSSRCALPGDERLVLATPSSAFDQLCSVGGVLDGGSSAPVGGRVAAELEVSYGPGASSWARTVPLDGGVDLILAAVGDRWVVIDAVAK